MLVNKKNWGENGGQVLLTVVLVMIVSLTVGLSLASRSIVDVRISTEEADSQRALAAAEAGIERALKEVTAVTSLSGTFSEINTSYDVDISGVEGELFLLNNGNLVEKGEGVDIWFVPHIDLTGDGEVEPDYSVDWDGGNSLDIYWGTSATECDNAALELIIILGPASSPRLNRYTVDPCDARRGDNNFDPPNPGTISIGGQTLQHRLRLNHVASGLNVLYARAIPIYTNAIMAVDAGESLPTQGYTIDSIGEFGSADSKAKRSINVFKQFGQLSVEYLNYGLFSP